MNAYISIHILFIYSHVGIFIREWHLYTHCPVRALEADSQVCVYIGGRPCTSPAVDSGLWSDRITGCTEQRQGLVAPVAEV